MCISLTEFHYGISCSKMRSYRFWSMQEVIKKRYYNMSDNILMLRGKIESSMEGKQVGKNNFILKKIGVEPGSHSVEVDFSPSSSTSSSQSPNPIPTFNFDRCFFTPGFILKSSYSTSASILRSYMELHDGKVIQLSDQKEELLVPRPSRVNSYCLTCRVFFQDYLTHLNLPAHQLAMKSSSFVGDIAKLCAIFSGEKEEVEVVKVRGKGKRIVKASKRTCRENKKFKMALMSTSTNIGEFSEEARKEVSI